MHVTLSGAKRHEGSPPCRGGILRLRLRMTFRNENGGPKSAVLVNCLLQASCDDQLLSMCAAFIACTALAQQVIHGAGSCILAGLGGQSKDILDRAQQRKVSVGYA